ncbi:uroporphyrinogen decarboxylase family protein [Brevibacillus choshinensis]|uniref:uroporphyrinogen decarboxylase family protein n=1 Tax=Brevibacillus choshinensis TaxID=54911 RepID=UPI002E1BCC69|nr:uroporphyrinogen decarboxylase family protein [Brevibacillus choshinensis]MED4782584.1 uroporphyrinogen decarboxylase family protein [Brevibacillus choshinensis]
MTLTATERIRMVLRGEQADRIPFSFWTHLPHVDLDPLKLAEETYEFYRRFRLDFIKNMPNGMFFVEDYGCQCDFSEIPNGGVAKITKYAVEKPEDWVVLTEPDVKKGALGRELLSIAHLLGKTKEEVPVLLTIFSPLTIAHKLCGSLMLEHLRNHPEKVKAGLDRIARTTAAFAQEALRKGCAGVFFANQMATSEMVTEAEYAEFGVPYDLQVLEAIQPFSWFNVVHIHGTNIYHHLMVDYPVQAINWHIWETEPKLQDFVQAAPDKIIVGGLQRSNITNGSIDEIIKEIQEVSRLTVGNRIILTPGCVIRYPVEETVLQQVSNEIIQHSKVVFRQSNTNSQMTQQ